MGNFEREQPIEAANRFVHTYFPNCKGALLAGSVVRGEATKTSDLDIIIFDNTIPSSYRESFVELGWPIEVFVHNLTSYKRFFEEDVARAQPSLPRMVTEGIILKDEGIVEAIKKEAKDLLDNGPEEWSDETLRTKRYFITDALEDFIGCSNREEEICIANALASLVSEFVLRTNQKWTGDSKWLVRSLRYYDVEFATYFMGTFDIFYKTGSKEEIISLVEKVLHPYGGKLFNGYSMGK